jgi:AcrR family transcriptional regulator
MGFGRFTGSVDLLWGTQPGPRRGPRPALTLEGIARAGIAIADAEGLAAVSMQRVAADLGVTKMALYRYAPGKAELVALMVDLGLGQPPELPRGWRNGLRTWALALLPVMLKHPWALEATAGPRVPGPNELAWMEAALATLVDTQLRGAERLDVVAVLAGHVRALAQQANSTEAHLNTMVTQLLVGRESRYPHVAAAMQSVSTEGGQEQALHFGLDLILDGLGARVRARSR